MRRLPFLRPRHLGLLRGLALPLAGLTLWQLATKLGLLDPRFFPPLEKVAAAAVSQIQGGTLLANLSTSLTRNFAGLLIGGLAGVMFGVLLGGVRAMDILLGGSFRALRQIALLAWIPMLCMWLGLGEMSKVAFIALAAFIPAAVNARQGMSTVPTALIEVGRALCFSRAAMLRRIYLPAARPFILTGLQLAAMYSWVATIGAEYFMANGPGIGGLILAGRDRFEMELVLLGILTLGLTGYAINSLLALAFRTGAALQTDQAI